jgi:hypothetical protein
VAKKAAGPTPNYRPQDGERLSYVNRRARELLMPVAAAGAADAPLTCCDAICDRLKPEPAEPA